MTCCAREYSVLYYNIYSNHWLSLNPLKYYVLIHTYVIISRNKRTKIYYYNYVCKFIPFMAVFARWCSVLRCCSLDSIVLILCMCVYYYIYIDLHKHIYYSIRNTIHIHTITVLHGSCLRCTSIFRAYDRCRAAHIRTFNDIKMFTTRSQEL